MNLDAEITVPCDPTKWTPLQIEICMSVANAKYWAFAAEAERLADFVRLGVITRPVAADYLQETAIYNGIIFEYGADRVQAIMASAFNEAAA